MRFVHTCVRVRDIDASLRFYEALGYERRGKLQFDGAYNIYLGLPGDGDTLELTVNEGQSEPYDLGDGYGHIAIMVDDIHAKVAELAEQGIEPEKPPYHPGGREELGPICFVAGPGRLPDRADRRRRVRDAAGLVSRGEVPQPVDPGREVVLAAAHRRRRATAGRRRTAGPPGTVIFDGPSVSCGPTIASWSCASRNALPPFAHCDWTNSNPRATLACRHMKITPRSRAVVLGALGQRLAVGDPAPDHPVAVHELAVERQAVARVHAPHVRADRAAQAVRVVAVVERVVARGLSATSAGSCRSGERSSGVPSRQRPTSLAASISSPPGYVCRRLAQRPPEARDVLVRACGTRGTSR